MQIESQPSLQQPLRHLHKAGDGVQRADGVADGALRVFARALHRRHRAPDVADVVQRIEDAEHVHPVRRRLLDEAVHHRVFVVPVAEQVLPAQQHLQPRVGHQLAERAQPLPRVFVQETDAGIERGAAPTFRRPIARLVDVLAGRNHVFHRHPRSQQALVAVPKYKFSDIYGFRHYMTSITLSGTQLVSQECWKCSTPLSLETPNWG